MMLLRVHGVLVGAFFFVFASSLAAQAHVLIDTVEPNDDRSARVTIGFDHSCDEADTTRLVLELPEGAAAIGAEGPAGWESRIESGTVEWTGPELETAMSQEFWVDVLLTGSPGQVFEFPVLQECANGETYLWDDTEADGELPIPSFVATSSVLAQAPTAAETGGAEIWQVAVVIGVIALGAGIAAARFLPRS